MSVYEAVKSGEIYQMPPKDLSEEGRTEWLKIQNQIINEERKQTALGL